MNRYFLYWLDGKVQMLLSEGSVEDAANEARIGFGGINAIDFYNNDVPSKHIYVKTGDRGEWVPMGNRTFRSLDEIDQAGREQFDNMANECQTLEYKLPSGNKVELQLRIHFTEADVFKSSYAVSYERINQDGLTDGSVSAFTRNFKEAFYVFKNLANCNNLSEAIRSTERNPEDYKSPLDKLIMEWNEQIRVYKLNHS